MASGITSIPFVYYSFRVCYVSVCCSQFVPAAKQKEADCQRPSLLIGLVERNANETGGCGSNVELT